MKARLTMAAALLAAGSAAGHAGTPAAIRITAPGPDEILYGTTRISAEPSTETNGDVAQVLFYLDPLPAPICNDTAAPFVCEFDAGTEFQGYTIRARALDSRGRFLGADTVETMAFPRPERVVERIIQVPVIATREDGILLELGQSELSCFYAGEPCEILGFETIVEKTTLPLSILVLVDVSPSVTAERADTLEALNTIVDHFPDRGEVALAEFARHYQRLGPVTTDRDELRRQMLRLSFESPYTCLMRALEHALSNLGAREGHRALFVVSDGEETCDARVSVGGHSAHFQTRMEVLAHIVELSRSVAVPIYIYRMGKVGGLVRTTADRGYEGLARETGGRLFATGDLYGIGRSFGDLIEDLETTWLVDISLPTEVPPGRPRRLQLELQESGGPRLRYPEYWDPDSLERSKIGFLDSESAETRYWAAKGLRSSRNPDALRKLLTAARRETQDASRLEELDSILAMTAAFLLHGDGQEQKLALAAIETLGRVEPAALQPLQPALAVYQKMEVPDRLKKRAAGSLSRPGPNGDR